MTSTSVSTYQQQHSASGAAGEFSANHQAAADPNAALQSGGGGGYAPNDSQLAGLVEAATAAAGQDVSEWAAAAAVAAAAGAAGAAGGHHHLNANNNHQHQHHHHHHILDEYDPELHIEDDAFDGEESFVTAGVSGARQLRGLGLGAAGEHMQSGLSRTVSRKRKRGEDPLDPALKSSTETMGDANPPHQQQHPKLPQQQQHHHQHQQFEGGDDLDSPALASPLSGTDTRASGIHSAAALFRQPSANKKYTRPPMSKLFSSLELSPENFLQLQAAAKAFMLDENHPERRDCVGQRGKGDTEIVKLRLWNCVRYFLDAEGNGERFFGENTVNEGMGARKYIWPRDQHKIISLVIPLLRRMVTNERQRQYAIESRKGGLSGERRKQKHDDGQQPLSEFNSGSPRPQQYLSDDQSRMQVSLPSRQQAHRQQQQHPAHQLSLSDFASASGSFASPSLPPPLPPPLSPQMHTNAADAAMSLGLTDLVLDGYPTDWDTVARTYDRYNHEQALDNLWSISGLQQPDWRGLVAAVDSHYQILHQGGYDCLKPCEDYNINRILTSDAMTNVQWRLGDSSNPSVRNEFASSITRDISRIIRDNIAAQQLGSSTPSQQGTRVDAPQQQQSAPQHISSSSSNAHVPQSSFGAAALPELGPSAPGPSAPQDTTLLLRVNVVQHGKRIVPRVDIPASQCPDLGALRQTILSRYANQLPSSAMSSGVGASSAKIDGGHSTSNVWVGSESHASSSSLSSSSAPLPLSQQQQQQPWDVKVWLANGLVSVQSDGEWTIALLSAATVEWMDGDLRVLVEVGVESV